MSICCRLVGFVLGKASNMQSSPSLSAKEFIMDPTYASILERALRVQAMVMGVRAQYQRLLEATILATPAVDKIDAKTLATYRKCLRDDQAYATLILIWKESEFFSDDLLGRVGLSRQFVDGTLTVWAFAKKAAKGVDDLSSINSQIRAVAIAAEAFGLVARNTGNRTNRPLQGTQRLHDFMLQLSENQHRLYSQLDDFTSLKSSGIAPEQK